MNFGNLNKLYNYITLNWQDILIAIAIFLVIFLLRKKISKLIVKISSNTKFIKSRNENGELENALLKPLSRFMVFIGIYFASEYLPISPIGDILMIKILKSALIITFASAMYHMEFIYEGMFHRFDGKLNLGTSEMVKQVTIKMIRVIIVLLAIAIVASEFFDVNGFIAGLGIAGLAFAMAAQDTLGSLFAGLAIILDKPFDVGDWISCNGIEGTVEELSFKSTRIRTFSKELVSVPNQILASNSISNFSRRGVRRVNFKLGVTYSTKKDQILEVCSKIEEHINSDERIDEENVIVKFDSFNSSSMDLLINYYSKTTDLKEYLQIKEDINLKIIEIFEESGVSIAFPSTSIYFENETKEFVTDKIL